MKEEIKKKWITALTDGSYRQTKGYLKDKDGYCCLGVLCDLSVQDGVGKWHDIVMMGGATYQQFITRTEKSTALLPTEVMEWAGMSDSCGSYSKSVLTSLNDSGVSFEGIAEVIECEF